MPELIINADDYGRSPRVNRAIELTAQAGRISSLTVLVNMPSAPEVVDLVRRLPPDVSIGLHLNLTEGRSIVDRSQIPSLVSANGAFWGPAQFVRRLLTGRISAHDLHHEILAQIRVLQGLLGAFTHFDSHHHVHRFPAVLKALAWAVGETYAPRRIRTNSRFLVASERLDHSRLRCCWHHWRHYPCAIMGVWLKARQKNLARAFKFVSPDYLLTPVPPIAARPLPLAAQRWGAVLGRLAEGRYEANFHPGTTERQELLLLSAAFGEALSQVDLVPYDIVDNW
jgi:predicted glycoside hydrolase/deacetylase ChbG (UPF0249 family)